MNKAPLIVEKQVNLSVEQAERLRQLAQAAQVSEDQIIARALAILFGLSDLSDDEAERRGWSFLSEDSLGRVWDNEEDAVYDNWQELYGVPTG